jgi:hypothetical protein
VTPKKMIVKIVNGCGRDAFCRFRVRVTKQRATPTVAASEGGREGEDGIRQKHQGRRERKRVLTIILLTVPSSTTCVATIPLARRAQNVAAIAPIVFF